MTTADVAAVMLLLALTVYAVFGGADFGAGFWDLTAGGTERGAAPRALIADAIGPVWEANHTWLIFAIVILWTAFPPAFAAIMSTLFVPLSLAAFGIVLRGAAFAFRPTAANLAGRRAAGAVFAISSVVTPFFLGAAVGAIVSGRVPLGNAAGDPMESWINPTSIFVGLFAVTICAYLAAVFLVADAQRRSETRLAAYFLRRATLAGLFAGVLAIGGLLVLQFDTPAFVEDLSGRGWPFILGSVVLGLAALVLLRRHALMFTRALAIGAVVAIVWGWGAAQYPDILPGSVSIADAAAPEGSLDALVVIFVVAAVLIVPSLALLFSLDQRSRLESHGLGTDMPGPAGHDG